MREVEGVSLNLFNVYIVAHRHDRHDVGAERPPDDVEHGRKQQGSNFHKIGEAPRDVGATVEGGTYVQNPPLHM